MKRRNEWNTYMTKMWSIMIVCKHKIFLRDKDFLYRSCGNEIMSWNGAVIFS